MTYTEIIEDEGFLDFLYLKSNIIPAGIGLIDNIYELLHKTREIINKKGRYRIALLTYSVDVFSYKTEINIEYFLKNYNDSDIEALAQCLWFIYKEGVTR